MTVRDRLMVALVFLALGALAVTFVLVFAFGERNPSPKSLQDTPNPAIPGEVLYLGTNSCIMRIEASGLNNREVVCPGRVDYLARLDERTIVYGIFGPPGSASVATQRDLVTGQQLAFPGGLDKSPLPNPAAEQRSVLGDYITIDPDGSVYRSNSTEPGRTRIFSCDCPNYHTPQFLTWSPDGAWLMLTYWGSGGPQQELWILARDGSFAGTLAVASREGNASWFIAGKGVLPRSALTPVAR